MSMVTCVRRRGVFKGRDRARRHLASPLRTCVPRGAREEWRICLDCSPFHAGDVPYRTSVFLGFGIMCLNVGVVCLPGRFHLLMGVVSSLRAAGDFHDVLC